MARFRDMPYHFIQERSTFPIKWITEHLGHTYDDMFSTTPMIGISALRQKSTSFLTSSNATSWGVVTRTAPSIFACTIRLNHINLILNGQVGASSADHILYSNISSLTSVRRWCRGACRSRGTPDHPNRRRIKTALSLHSFSAPSRLLHYPEIRARIRWTLCTSCYRRTGNKNVYNLFMSWNIRWKSRDAYNRRPAGTALMDLFAQCPHNAGHRRPANVYITYPHLQSYEKTLWKLISADKQWKKSCPAKTESTLNRLIFCVRFSVRIPPTHSSPPSSSVHVNIINVWEFIHVSTGFFLPQCTGTFFIFTFILYVSLKLSTTFK